MSKCSAARAVYVPQRKGSLGLDTSPEFHLQLLEGAAKGRKVFNTHWDDDYNVEKQLLWHEISQEVEIWEKEGSLDLLIFRGRQLAVKLKDQGEGLHLRALKVYCKFLEISSAKHCNFKPKGTPKERSIDLEKFSFNPSYLEANKAESFSSIARGDPLQGEPSFFEPDNLEGKMDRGSRAESQPEDRLYHDDHKFKRENERSRLMSISDLDEENQPGSVKWHKKVSAHGNKDDPLGWEELKIELVNDEKDEVKNSPAIGNRLSVENFKGDFRETIKWTDGNKTYQASNVKDIRKNHCIQIEGSFKKRCMTYRWKNYYGFITRSGLLIYFGLEKNNDLTFKRAVDFQENSITDIKESQYMFNVNAAGRNWLMKFANEKDFSNWQKTIRRFSRPPPDKSS